MSLPELKLLSFANEYRCHAPGCTHEVSDGWAIKGPRTSVLLCSFKCLVRWALLQPINWSGQEPWRL